MTPSPTQSPLVIGLTGPIGSGVSTCAKILQNHSFQRLKISDYVKKELLAQESLDTLTELEALPQLRRKMQDLGNKKRREGSNSYWAEMAIQEAAEGNEIVIDGVRNLGEVERFRDCFPRFHLVAIVANKDTRWGRIKTRYNENQREFNEDDERDFDEELPYGQQVDKCVLEADCILFNEDSLGTSSLRTQSLYDQLKPNIDLMRGCNNGRGPTAEESHMATAYAQSYRSLCLKRYVGAVIVSDRGLPLSLGYNENPVGMEPCKSQFGYCYITLATKIITTPGPQRTASWGVESNS